jgi:hypothetical protein
VDNFTYFLSEGKEVIAKKCPENQIFPKKPYIWHITLFAIYSQPKN